MELRIPMNPNTYNEIKHYEPAQLLYLAALTFGDRINREIIYKVEKSDKLNMTPSQLRRAIEVIRDSRTCQVLTKGIHNESDKAKFGTTIIINAHQFLSSFEGEVTQGDVRVADHLSISEDEYKSFIKVYTKEMVDRTLEAIANYSENYKYKSLRITLKQWLERDKARQAKEKANLSINTREIIQ